MIKLFASDLDGTLLNENHMTDDYILETIEQVKQAGRVFAVATGRSLHDHEVNRLQLNPVFKISMNGAVIKDKDGNTIYQRPIPKEFVSAFVDYFENYDIDYCGVDYTYSTISREHKIDRFQRRGFKDVAGNPLRIRDFFQDFQFDTDKEKIKKLDIYKINTNIHNVEVVAKIKALLLLNDDKIINAPSSGTFFEITAKNVNKGEAIAYLADLLSIKEDEVAVYGDSGNDLAMLERFTNSYTLEDATIEAKKAAHYCLGLNKDYVVSKHIRHSLNDYKEK